MQLDDCIFCKIARGEIGCGKVYEDESQGSSPFFDYSQGAY